MNKFWIVLGHTYFSRLKSKAFIISTLVVFLFIFGIANIQSIIQLFTGDDELEQVIVIDESGELFAPLETSISQLDEEVELIAYEESEEVGKSAVQNEEYDGLLILELDENNLPIATYYENNAAESSLQYTIEQQLQQVKIAIATEQAGVDEATLASIYEEMPFEKIALDEATKTDEELNQARGIVYIMLFVLYMAVIIYGQMIAMDVATEKSSRVMEILISSASPVTHMFAKIIGIALLGLTQMVLFFIVGASLISTKMDTTSGEIFEFFGFTSTSISIYFYALLFFILGYFLYATIAAMLGSLVSRVEDVQQLIMPMVFLIMIAFFIAMFGLTVPDAKFITITSFIPFFSPMIMFLRVGMLEVPIWEVIVSVGLLVGTIILLAILGARIYRGGVLMYGPSRSLKDFKKALMLTKKEK
ncbi:ABC transporter permease [Pseudogracilibacillus auburnensis]|uniref:ABC-2 type transport system permease protein n=1 Tax=Pseudogracilibacillus auburnensis TaxID=1494959 RepID=A0A2V3VYC2_9BACI|nr:ABC transporter permease [Pseudogracilibacillus auburnensis]MBO1002912.1 ABC transporter permease [Pseudogracilibacillus auburnensis]PXW87007.1 ABC-2 type transport system permease protein [Pseudogracilibacillus auburnensis]